MQKMVVKNRGGEVGMLCNMEKKQPCWGKDRGGDTLGS